MASAPPAHPLRPYYVPVPDSEFAFGGPSIPSAPTSSSAPTASSFRIATTNRYESTLADFQDVDVPTAGTMLRAFVTSSLLSFTSTALVMPFEVGKTLAQVQWVPRDGLDPLVWGADESVVEEETVEVSADHRCCSCQASGGVLSRLQWRTVARNVRA